MVVAVLAVHADQVAATEVALVAAEDRVVALGKHTSANQIGHRELLCALFYAYVCVSCFHRKHISDLCLS